MEFVIRSQVLFLILIFLGMAGCSQRPSSVLSAQQSPTGIVGGEPLSPEDPLAKSIVSLEGEGLGPYCSGVLIAKNLVLTAAHCATATVMPNQISVVFGVDLRAPAGKVKVLGGQVPEGWPALNMKQEKNWSDIALLRLEQEAPAGFEPARLMMDPSKLQAGLDVILVGSGYSNMKPTVDPFKNLKVTVKLTDPQYSETEIFFDQFEGKGACHGDSGGPAYLIIDQELYVLSVMSRAATADAAFDCLGGSIAMAVALNRPFIEKAMFELTSKNFVPNQPIPRPLFSK